MKLVHLVPGKNYYENCNEKIILNHFISLSTSGEHLKSCYFQNDAAQFSFFMRKNGYD